MLALVAGVTLFGGAGRGGPGADDDRAGRPRPGRHHGPDRGADDHHDRGPGVDDAGDGLLDFHFDANEKVWIIVGALVAVALLLLVLTIIYWRHTKPDRPKADKRIERAERKEQKRRRKATGEDPFAEEADEGPDDDGSAGTPSGPIDLDEVLAPPDPARSVFGTPDEPGESPR